MGWDDDDQGQVSAAAPVTYRPAPRPIEIRPPAPPPPPPSADRVSEHPRAPEPQEAFRPSPDLSEDGPPSGRIQPLKEGLQAWKAGPTEAEPGGDQERPAVGEPRGNGTAKAVEESAGNGSVEEPERNGKAPAVEKSAPNGAAQPDPAPAETPDAPPPGGTEYVSAQVGAEGADDKPSAKKTEAKEAGPATTLAEANRLAEKGFGKPYSADDYKKMAEGVFGDGATKSEPGRTDYVNKMRGNEAYGALFDGMKAGSADAMDAVRGHLFPKEENDRTRAGQVEAAQLVSVFPDKLTRDDLAGLEKMAASKDPAVRGAAVLAIDRAAQSKVEGGADAWERVKASGPVTERRVKELTEAAAGGDKEAVKTLQSAATDPTRTAGMFAPQRERVQADALAGVDAARGKGGDAAYYDTVVGGLGKPGPAEAAMRQALDKGDPKAYEALRATLQTPATDDAGRARQSRAVELLTQDPKKITPESAQTVAGLIGGKDAQLGTKAAFHLSDAALKESPEAAKALDAVGDKAPPTPYRIAQQGKKAAAGDAESIDALRSNLDDPTRLDGLTDPQKRLVRESTSMALMGARDHLGSGDYRALWTNGVGVDRMFADEAVKGNAQVLDVLRESAHGDNEAKANFAAEALSKREKPDAADYRALAAGGGLEDGARNSDARKALEAGLKDNRDGARDAVLDQLNRDPETARDKDRQRGAAGMLGRNPAQIGEAEVAGLEKMGASKDAASRNAAVEALGKAAEANRPGAKEALGRLQAGNNGVMSPDRIKQDAEKIKTGDAEASKRVRSVLTDPGVTEGMSPDAQRQMKRDAVAALGAGGKSMSPDDARALGDALKSYDTQGEAFTALKASALAGNKDALAALDASDMSDARKVAADVRKGVTGYKTVGFNGGHAELAMKGDQIHRAELTSPDGNGGWATRTLERDGKGGWKDVRGAIGARGNLDSAPTAYTEGDVRLNRKDGYEALEVNLANPAEGRYDRTTYGAFSTRTEHIDRMGTTQRVVETEQDGKGEVRRAKTSYPGTGAQRVVENNNGKFTVRTDGNGSYRIPGTDAHVNAIYGDQPDARDLAGMRIVNGNLVFRSKSGGDITDYADASTRGPRSTTEALQPPVTRDGVTTTSDRLGRIVQVQKGNETWSFGYDYGDVTRQTYTRKDGDKSVTQTMRAQGSKTVETTRKGVVGQNAEGLAQRPDKWDVYESRAWETYKKWDNGWVGNVTPGQDGSITYNSATETRVRKPNGDTQIDGRFTKVSRLETADGRVEIQNGAGAKWQLQTDANGVKSVTDADGLKHARNADGSWTTTGKDGKTETWKGSVDYTRDRLVVTRLDEGGRRGIAEQRFLDGKKDAFYPDAGHAKYNPQDKYLEDKQKATGNQAATLGQFKDAYKARLDVHHDFVNENAKVREQYLDAQLKARKGYDANEKYQGAKKAVDEYRAANLTPLREAVDKGDWETADKLAEKSGREFYNDFAKVDAAIKDYRQDMPGTAELANAAWEGFKEKGKATIDFVAKHPVESALIAIPMVAIGAAGGGELLLVGGTLMGGYEMTQGLANVDAAYRNRDPLQAIQGAGQFGGGGFELAATWGPHFAAKGIGAAARGLRGTGELPGVPPKIAEAPIDPLAPPKIVEPPAMKVVEPPAVPKVEPVAPKSEVPVRPVEPGAPAVEPTAPKAVDPLAPKPVEPTAPKPVEPTAPKAAEPAGSKPAEPNPSKPAEAGGSKPVEPARPADPPPPAKDPYTPEARDILDKGMAKADQNRLVEREALVKNLEQAKSQQKTAKPSQTERAGERVRVQEEKLQQFDADQKILDDPANGRLKELAWDSATGKYRLNEAQAALEAERAGLLPGPVRRAVVGAEKSGDFVDGTGKIWDHVDVSRPGALESAVGKMGSGEHALVDMRHVPEAERAAMKGRIDQIRKSLTDPEAKVDLSDLPAKQQKALQAQIDKARADLKTNGTQLGDVKYVEPVEPTAPRVVDPVAPGGPPATTAPPAAAPKAPAADPAAAALNLDEAGFFKPGTKLHVTDPKLGTDFHFEVAEKGALTPKQLDGLVDGLKKHPDVASGRLSKMDVKIEKKLPTENEWGLNPEKTYGLAEPDGRTVRLFTEPIEKAGVSAGDVLAHEFGHGYHNVRELPSGFVDLYKKSVSSYLQDSVPGMKPEMADQVAARLADNKPALGDVGYAARKNEMLAEMYRMRGITEKGKTYAEGLEQMRNEAAAIKDPELRSAQMMRVKALEHGEPLFRTLDKEGYFARGPVSGTKPVAPDGVQPMGASSPFELQAGGGRKLEIPRNGEGTIGRNPDSSLVLDDTHASRAHAAVATRDGKPHIRDLGSRNGTFVNDKALKPNEWAPLQAGDRVRIGNTEFKVGGGQGPGEALPPGAQVVAKPPRPPYNPDHAMWDIQLKPPPPGGPIKPAVAPTELNAAQSKAIVGKAQIAPSPLGRPAGVEPMSQNALQEMGLAPRTTLQVGDQKVHVSDHFSMDGRKAFVAYVEDAKGNTHVRTFYQSGSQGLWRSASHGDARGWIGKGLGEESTNLPISMQRDLSNLAARGKGVDLSPDKAKQAFYGSLEMGGVAPPKDFYTTAKGHQIGEFTELVKGPGRNYGRPDAFKFDDPNHAPDFGKAPTMQYSFEHGQYGKVDAHAYTSKDGRYQYLFFKDGQGRGWLASIEDAHAPLNNWGVRTRFVEGHDLHMPPAEYHSQIPYGFNGKPVSSQYSDAYEYTRRLQIVRDYLQAQGK